MLSQKKKLTSSKDPSPRQNDNIESDSDSASDSDVEVIEVEQAPSSSKKGKNPTHTPTPTAASAAATAAATLPSAPPNTPPPLTDEGSAADESSNLKELTRTKKLLANKINGLEKKLMGESDPTLRQEIQTNLDKFRNQQSEIEHRIAVLNGTDGALALYDEKSSSLQAPAVGKLAACEAHADHFSHAQASAPPLDAPDFLPYQDALLPSYEQVYFETYGHYPDPQAPAETALATQVAKRHAEAARWLALPVRSRASRATAFNDKVSDLNRERGLTADSHHITLEELPTDEISTKFWKRISEHHREDPTQVTDPVTRSLGGNDFLKRRSFARDIPVYIPESYIKDAVETAKTNHGASGGAAASKSTWTEPMRLRAAKEAVQRFTGKDSYDEISVLMGTSQKEFGVTSDITGTKVDSGKIKVYTDFSGNTAHVFGPGFYKNMTRTFFSGKVLNEVGSKEPIPLNTDYYRDKSSTFTIVTIKQGEYGICSVQEKSKAHHAEETTAENHWRNVHRLLPGRYLFLNRHVTYIGKCTLQPNQPVTLTVAQGIDPSVAEQFKNRMQILPLTAGHFVFCRDSKGTFPIPCDPDGLPLVIDKQASETLLNVCRMTDDISASTEEAGKVGCHRVRLQAGQRLILRTNEGQDIVHTHNAQDPRFNCLFISRRFFEFNGTIANKQTALLAGKDCQSVQLNPSQRLLLADTNNQLKFLDGQVGQATFVLRRPFTVLQLIDKADNLFHYPLANTGKSLDELGRAITYCQPAENQVMVVYSNQRQCVEFYPAANTYYFAQPEYAFLGIADLNSEKEQKFHCTEVGDITVFRVQQGELALVLVNGEYKVMGPSNRPYCLMGRDRFCGLLDREQTHTAHGSLHILCLKGEEVAVVDVDGATKVLNPRATQADQQSSGHSIYFFVASVTFKFYGAIKVLDERHQQLGPIDFFKVGVGEVGYGVVNGGRHNNQSNMVLYQSGYYQKNRNVDPDLFQGFFETRITDLTIQVPNVITINSIGAAVTVGVSVKIADPAKAIEVFVLNRSDKEASADPHVLINDIVSDIVKNQILVTCAGKPPLGFSQGQCDLFRKSASATSIISSPNAEEQEAARNDFTEDLSSHLDHSLEKLGLSVSSTRLQAWETQPEFVNFIRARAQEQFHAESQRNLDRIARESALEAADNEKKMQAAKNAQRTLEREREAADAMQKAQSSADQNTIQELAKSDLSNKQALQHQENELAQKRIEMQRVDLENEQKLQQMQAELKFAELAAKREAIKQAAGKIAEAEAQSQIADLRLATAEREAKCLEISSTAEAAADRRKLENQAYVVKEVTYGGIAPDQIATVLELQQRTKMAELMTTMALQGGVNNPYMTWSTTPEFAQLLGVVQSQTGVDPLKQNLPAVQRTDTHLTLHSTPATASDAVTSATMASQLSSTALAASPGNSAHTLFANKTAPMAGGAAATIVPPQLTSSIAATTGASVSQTQANNY